MKQFDAAGSKTASIPLKNPEEIRGERKQKAQKNSQKQGMAVREQREKIENGQKGDKRFEDEGEAVV